MRVVPSAARVNFFPRFVIQSPQRVRIYVRITEAGQRYYELPRKLGQANFGRVGALICVNCCWRDGEGNRKYSLLGVHDLAGRAEVSRGWDSSGSHILPQSLH